MVPRQVFPPEALAEAYTRAEVFLQVMREEEGLTLQPLKLKDLYRPDMFLPRPLLFGKRDISFGVPRSAPPGSGGEARYGTLFDSLPVGAAVLSPSGAVRDLNNSAQRLLGYDRFALSEDPLGPVRKGGGLIGALRLVSTLRRSGRARGRIAARSRVGRLLRLDAECSILAGGEVLVLLYDVTRVAREEEEHIRGSWFLSSILEGLPYPVAVFSSGRMRYRNRRFREDLETQGDAPGRSSLKGGGRRNAEVLRGLLRRRGSLGADSLEESREATLVTAQGETRRYEVRLGRLEGEGSRILAFFDVSARHALTERLAEAEAGFRALAEESPGGVCVQRGGAITYVNGAFLRMMGASRADEYAGRRELPFRMAAPGARARGTRSARQAPAPPEEHIWESEGERADGTKVPLEVVSRTVPLGGETSTVYYLRDLTEKTRELDLLEKERKALRLLEQILDMQGSGVSPAGLEQGFLERSLKAFGMQMGAVYRCAGDRLELLHHSGMAGKLLEAVSEHSRTEGITGFVLKTLEALALRPEAHPAHLPHGSVFASAGLRSVIYVPLHSGGRAVGVLMLGSRTEPEMPREPEPLLARMGALMGRELAAAEAAAQVAASETRYRQLVESLPDVVYTLAPSGSVTFISPKVVQLLGYAPEEFQRSADFWRGLLHPDDRARYSERMTRQEAAADSFRIEYRALPKGKASYRWLRDSVQYRRGPGGRLESVTGILTDITETVELESALVRSEQTRANVLESVHEGVFVLNEALEYLDWNGAMERITSVAREGVVGHAAREATPQLMTESIMAMVEAALGGKPGVSEDVALGRTGDGRERFVWVRVSPLRDSSGALRGVVGVTTEITERKELERNLRESEETLRRVIDSMGDALMISDLQGRVWEVNSGFCALTGVMRREAIGQAFPYPWLPDTEMARFVRWVAELREKSYLRDFDMSWRHRDGREVSISLNTTLLRNARGDPVAMLNIARDITERKRLATELQRKNTQIEMLNRIISKANSTLDFGEMFESIATEVRAMLPCEQVCVGVLTGDRSSLQIYGCTEAGPRAHGAGTVVGLAGTAALETIRQGRALVTPDAGGDTSGIGGKGRKKHRSLLTIPISLEKETVGVLELSASGPGVFRPEDAGGLGALADQIGAMVDRVRLFRKVAEDGAFIHGLVNSIDSPVYSVDRLFRISEANAAFSEYAALWTPDAVRAGETFRGRSLRDLVPREDLWRRWHRQARRLLVREADSYTEEYGLQEGDVRKTYTLSITPMVVQGEVSSLVFLHSDITGLKTAEEELRRRNRELLALNTIGTALSRSLHLDEVLAVACAQVREVAGADLVFVYRTGSRRDSLELAHSVGMDPAQAGRLQYLSTEGSATGRVIGEGVSLFIERGVAEDPRITPQGREVFRSRGIESLGLIPVRSKSRITGAIGVAFSGPHAFTDQEQQLLTLIGSQTAAGLENAQLYAEVQSQVRSLTSLYELGKKLTGTLDLQEVLLSVHAETARAIPLDLFRYAAYDAGSSLLTTLLEVRGASPAAESRHHTEVVSPGSPLWDVVQSGVSLLREDPPGDESRMAAASRSRAGIAGVLEVAVAGKGVYTEAHLRLLESIATLTEIAIQKARLHEDTLEKTGEIEARNRELDDFTYVVSHDLKEPLISIEGYSKILLSDYREALEGEGKEYLHSIVHSSARMKQLIDDLLTLSRLGRVREALSRVPSGKVVQEVLHDLRFSLEERAVVVTVPDDLPEVHYNRTQLSMVFRNLISNALKFNDKPAPTIHIGHERVGDAHVFSVTDNGIGIEREYYEKVFMIFQRLHRPEAYRGTGAGLTIVKKIVENHRGRIWVDSVPGEGTTFYFTVPR
ncbi:MAG: PAS domain S-box protein [Bacteroidota bacterium]